MNSKLILLIGGGVLLYLWYKNNPAGSAATTLPADAVGVTQQGTETPTTLTSGQQITVGNQTLAGPGYIYYSPSTRQFYVSSTVPTAAQLAAYNALIASSTPSSTTTGTGTSSTAPASTGTYRTPTGANVPTPTTLAGLWTAIQQWAAADTNFTNSGGVLSGTADHWSFYVSYIWPTAPANYTGTWPPDLSKVFPGVDLSQPMTATTFWAGMGGYLQSGGLSGLRGLSGIGSVNRFRVRGRGGWAA